MKKNLINFIILIVVFVGCRWTEMWREVVFWYPNWTSDGKIVCWQSNALIKNWEDIIGPGYGANVIDWDWTIIEVNLDGSNIRQVVKIDKQSGWSGENFGEVSGHPCISSVGDKIAFSLWNFTDWSSELIGIFIVNRDGTGLKKIVHKGTYPDLSPDGKKVVYEKPGEGIWIINADGTGDHQITSDPADCYPAWSPLGDKIAFLRYGLYIMDTTGNNLQPIPATGIEFPDWSWDGRYIVTGGRYIFDLQTMEEDTVNLLLNPKFSPDGTRFVGGGSIGYERGICVINVDGAGKKLVLKDISRRESWGLW